MKEKSHAAGLLDGDTTTFSKFLMEMHSSLMRSGLRKGYLTEDIQDAISNVFISLLEKKEEILRNLISTSETNEEIANKLSSYINRVFYNQLRSVRKSLPTSEPFNSEDYFASNSSSEEESNANLIALARAIEELSETEQFIIRSSALSIPLVEIAEELGISPSQARKIRYRSRILLKKLMKSELGKENLDTP